MCGRLFLGVVSGLQFPKEIDFKSCLFLLLWVLSRTQCQEPSKANVPLPRPWWFHIQRHLEVAWQPSVKHLLFSKWTELPIPRSLWLRAKSQPKDKREWETEGVLAWALLCTAYSQGVHMTLTNWRTINHSPFYAMVPWTLGKWQAALVTWQCWAAPGVLLKCHTDKTIRKQQHINQNTEVIFLCGWKLTFTYHYFFHLKKSL